MDRDSHSPPLFSETRAAFQQHLHEKPNKRRISQSQRLRLVDVLTNPEIRPSSQQEFSRRHYVKKTFAWDTTKQILLAKASGRKQHRKVIAEEEIVDVVKGVHLSTGHAGWDATWSSVGSSYYGIL